MWEVWRLFPTHPFFTGALFSTPFQGCEEVLFDLRKRMLLLKHQEGWGRVCMSLFPLLIVAPAVHTTS